MCEALGAQKLKQSSLAPYFQAVCPLCREDKTNDNYTNNDPHNKCKEKVQAKYHENSRHERKLNGGRVP